MQQDSREALFNLIHTIHETAREKGWWPSDKLVRAQRYEPECTLAMLALAHSELSEAVECVRAREIETVLQGSKPHGFHVELADTVIRILDLVCATGDEDAFLDALEAKLAYNTTRDHRHGDKAI